MVSTRRGAQTGPAENMETTTDQTLSLRKKPVRKATAAKTAAAKTETEGPKKRGGRPKKAVQAVAEEGEKEEATTAPEPESAKPTRGTRATGTRGKQQPKADEPDAKPTRRPTMRKAKVDVQPDVPVLEPKAPTTRATRATRATVGKALSPKKVTQVSRAPTRATRTQDDKAKVTKDAPAKRTTQTRSKRRAVSNENEGVEASKAALQEEASEEDPADEDTGAPYSPLRHEEVAHEFEDKAQDAESEPPMSSRPTTPGGSPAPSSNGTDKERETASNTPSAAESEAEDEAEDGSEDELCGPKTPMKRSSPGAERRYLSSVQKTVQRIERESRMETPGLSPNVRVRRGPTPQTQKPYARPQLPGSAARSMTVARGSDRAFVFRPLRKASADQGQLPAMEEEEDSIASIGSPLAKKYEAETVTSSPSPSEPEAHLEAEDTEDEIEEAPVYHDHSLTDSEAPVEHYVELALDSDIDETTLHGMDVGHSVDDVTEDHEIVEGVDATDDASVASDNDETVARQRADPNETVLIDDEEDGDDVDESLLSESQQQDDADVDGSVIHNGDFEEPSVLFDLGPIEQGAHEQEDSFAISDTEDEPQTIDWQNLREDVTIPVNFDWHLTGVGQQHMQREVEQSEDIDPNTGFLKDRTSRASLIMEPSAAEDAFDELEATLNLSEFVDVGALAEPTTRLSVPGPIGVGNSESEDAIDISLSSHNSGSAAETDTGANIEKVSVEDDNQNLNNGIDSQTTPDRSTPAPLSTHDSEIDISLSTPEPAHEEPAQPETPHYALPTISFDARRKSLPAFLHHTPVNSSGARPKTSDGTSISRLANPFVQAWYHGARQKSIASTPLASPSARRPSTAYGGLGSTGRKSSFADTLRSAKKGAESSPRRALQAELPMTDEASPSRTLGERYPNSIKVGRESSVAMTSRSTSKTARASFSERKQAALPASTATPTPAEATPSKTPGERYPKSAKRGAMYGGEYPEESLVQPGTPVTVSKTQTTPQATPRERYPRSAKQNRPSLGVPKATPSTARKSTSSPQKTSQTTPKPSAAKSASPAEAATSPAATTAPSPAQTTPQSERFPRMNRRTYAIPKSQHATTIAAPSRFHTPTKSPLKPPGPSTAQKPSSLRKLALTKTTQATPQKTPLKAAGAETPGALSVPMTPHPSAPLRGVLALVEIFTLEGASASAPFVALLQRLGARTTRVWKEGVTHVVFKDGSPTTLQKVRLHNKDVAEAGEGMGKSVIHCVNSRWVSDCDAEGRHVDERDEEYVVDVSEVPRGGKRRRKSMEPSALVNLGGNVVGPGGRKASLGRSSLGRSPMKLAGESPIKMDVEKHGSVEVADGEVEVTPKALQMGGEGDKENWGAGEDSPVTPDWIGAPEKLVQQTAPIDRVRKLEVKGGQGGNRRLTFWKGA